MSGQPLFDKLSFHPLYLDLLANGQKLGTATGFVIIRDSKRLLITNWHVLSGINPETSKIAHSSGAVPDTVVIKLHDKSSYDRRIEFSVPLFSDDSHVDKSWFEHPAGKKVDVAALPLGELPIGSMAAPIDIQPASPNICVYPGAKIFIIGYPLGFSIDNKWPIWKIGHVASDYDLDWDGKPAFLIDATTRPGMSGSPVFFRDNAWMQRDGNFITGALKPIVKFMGIYSGRIHRDSEIGMVWRPRCLNELVSSLGKR